MKPSGSSVVPIHGLSYKDESGDTTRWLDELGDLYEQTGADRDGRVEIEWGVYGVSETYVIDHNGCIVCKHIGPVTPKERDDILLPLIRKPQQATAHAAPN